jgi:multicomponent K+:H+ antiporter subunit E
MTDRLPLMWVALVVLWLVLNDTSRPADVVVGALVALGGVLALARLQPDRTRVRRPLVAVKLAGTVLLDIVRSNLAVAAIVLRPGTAGRVAGFVDIPLDTREPAALAALACIITATPGTAWAKYDSEANVVTIHVLDLVDGPAVARTIKARYEAKLREVFE